ncbi:MAG TPA: TetR/AcrR family transcriptional regulator [Acidimicrobiales bacterium]|nr:TetR/AcrR family transcriptional regulator [Acidimicrobiales bacterium]
MSEARSPWDPPGRPLLPPRATADGTHRRLLEVALVAFGERGFHGVSVREIANSAGIRASSVYAHIESKEQLLFELMLTGHEEHHDALRLALLEAGASPVEQITRLTGAHVRFHAGYPLLARVSNREMAALGPASRERVRAVRSQSEQLFLDVIDRGIRLRVFDVAQPWLGLAAIGGMGIRVAEWWDGSMGLGVEEVVAAYAEFAVRILISGSAGS